MPVTVRCIQGFDELLCGHVLSCIYPFSSPCSIMSLISRFLAFLIFFPLFAPRFFLPFFLSSLWIFPLLFRSSFVYFVFVFGIYFPAWVVHLVLFIELFIF